MTSVAERLAELPADRRKAALGSLTAAEAEELLHAWRFWARPSQIAPDGDWLVWLILAGRGFGKTRTGAEWVREEVDAGRARRIALVAETAADARDVMVEGESGLLSIYPPKLRPLYEPSKRRVTWRNGAVATLYNATEPDQLRGPQHDLAWCFVAGTMVETIRGQRPIETLQRGDWVRTRVGPRLILAAAMTAADADLWELTSEDGRSLIGTADHPVFVEGSGFLPLRLLRNGDTLSVWKPYTSSGAVSAGIATAPATTGTGRASSTIGNCFRSTTALCQRTWTFITATAIRATTICRTSLLSPAPSICANMGLAVSSFGAPKSVGGTQPKTSGESESRSASCAHIVDPSSLQPGCAPSSAPQPVEPLTFVREIPDTATSAVASVRRLNKRAAVYDITVDGAHEYFANGILVHNCDESAKWRYIQETFDQLMFGLRLGPRPRALISTTPRPIPLIRDLMKREGNDVVVTRGGTYDNRANLAVSFIQTMRDKYEGTRLGRQELNAEILDDVPGALWTRAMLDEHRVKPDDLPEMRRIVVAVDPAVTSDETSDEPGENGIVAAGLGINGRAYVLDDASLMGTPKAWASRAISTLDRFEGDAIVVEINQGGEMVTSTIRTVRPSVRIKEVRASRGKHVRAEPVSALYEQGRVSHVGTFAALEDQMVLMTPQGYLGTSSPDRLDALVWALTELFPAVIRRERKPEPKAAPRPGASWMAS